MTLSSACWEEQILKNRQWWPFNWLYENQIRYTYMAGQRALRDRDNVMGLTAFKTFCSLPQRIKPKTIGFACDTGSINRLHARMSLVKSFRGIQLEGYSAQTVQGYNALFRVFLTHSALEGFCNVYGYNRSWPKMGQDLTPVIAPYNPAPVLRIFRERDTQDKLYAFLQRHLTGKSLLRDLKDCKECTSDNIVAISAAMRHVFAHGVLTANANDMNPRAAAAIGTGVADFLVGVIDAEFTRTVESYCAKTGIAPLQQP